MTALFLTALLCTLACIYVLRPVALHAGLVDKPDARKQHDGDVPLIGGLGVFAALALTAFAFPAEQSFPAVLWALGLLLIVLGIADDIFALGAKFRLVVQIGIALLMVVWGDVRIESIGTLIGGEPIVLGPTLSVVFTIMCVVGAINAINMIDGVDGLSGSMLLVSFAALATLAMLAGRPEGTLLVAICAALLGFLFFNARVAQSRAKVFLGDSGSMFFGLVLVWFFVELTQSESPALGAVSAGWIFGLPLMDTVRVMVNRVYEKRSPFDAGRDHLHHLLLTRGYSSNKTVLIMLAMHIALVLTGLLFVTTPSAEPFLFWAFVGLTVSFFGYVRWRVGRNSRQTAKIR